MFSVVYEQDGIVVVNKPVGLPSQPTRDGRDNLYELLQQQFSYVGMHHRLDTVVSGLLLVTIDKRWNRAISQAFQQQLIKRSYLLAVVGDPGSAGQWTWALDGKKACTHWQKLRYQNGYSILQAHLESGRKHQLRKHAKQAGHPILGDRRYGGSAAKLCSRIALHASELRFTHPSSQVEERLKAKTPEELQPIFGA